MCLPVYVPCMYVCMPHGMVWRSGENSEESGFSFCHPASRDWAQLVRLGYRPVGPSHWSSQLILYLHFESWDKSDDELLYLFFRWLFWKCVWAFYLHICVCASACRGRERVWVSQGTPVSDVLWAVMWVLGTEARSSARVTSALNLRAIPPAPLYFSSSEWTV